MSPIETELQLVNGHHQVSLRPSEGRVVIGDPFDALQVVQLRAPAFCRRFRRRAIQISDLRLEQIRAARIL
jgi:hypothetical protein